MFEKDPPAPPRRQHPFVESARSAATPTPYRTRAFPKTQRRTTGIYHLRVHGCCAAARPMAIRPTPPDARVGRETTAPIAPSATNQQHPQKPDSLHNNGNNLHNNGNKNSDNDTFVVAVANPYYEFGGPLGVTAIMLALPLVVLLLAHWSAMGRMDGSFLLIFQNNSNSSNASSNANSIWSHIWHSPVLCPSCSSLFPTNNNAIRVTSPTTTTTTQLASMLSSVSGSLDEFFSTVWTTQPQPPPPQQGESSFYFDFWNNLPMLVACAGAVVLWFAWHMALERLLPCDVVLGAPIAMGGTDKDGRTTPTAFISLPYRINGHLALWVTGFVLTCAWPVYNPHHGAWQPASFPHWSFLYDYFAELALVTSAFCTVLATVLYITSFRGSRKSDSQTRDTVVLAAGGTTGNALYDFYMGRELNPRWSTTSLDWKEFCELRPGLMAWMIFNAACAHQQQAVQGYISVSMMLVNLFQGLYIWDALYQERAILSTMDITTDGFGFMLVFGDLCWVPFTYSLQARYLVHHDPQYTAGPLAAIVALNALGYMIFRGANGQKDAFRRDPLGPSVAHLSFLQTQRGTRLLTSGWWGMARKINYTGDWIMGLSWCLLCGTDSIVPYFYAIYFAILLIHRANRDDHLCHEKYGDDWITYKKLVPHRFIPGVV